MSHVDSGFCITDITALALTVKAQCPDLELVRQESYRTWISDHGKLVGDYPLPGIYQIKMMAALKRQNIDVHGKAAKQQVELPANLLDLEKKPWTLEEQKQMFRDPTFAKAYEKICQDVVGKDAEFVIKHKAGKGRKGSYEIGLVPHPVSKGEYVMMADFYAQGNGILEATGVGKHSHTKGKDSHTNGKDGWGSDLKKSYAVCAAERKIQGEIANGNPEFGSYKKTILPDGRVKLDVSPRRGV